MAWALAMSITLLTKTNPQPSVWQPLHWTPSKNAPSSEYFGRFAPIYDKIGTRNALSLELAFLFKDQSRRCCGKVMSQDFVCNFLFSWFTERVNKRYSLGSAERRTDLLSEGASGHFHCGWRFLDKCHTKWECSVLNCFVAVFQFIVLLLLFWFALLILFASLS